MDAVTVTLTGTNALAGYLQPGARVDVYANITKVSSSSGLTSTLPLPCTELAMANIQVLDVQSTVPSFAGHKSAAGRAIPSHGDAVACHESEPSEERPVPRPERDPVSRTDAAGRQSLRRCSSASAPTRRRRRHDQPPDSRHQPVAGARPGHSSLARPRLRGRHQRQRRSMSPKRSRSTVRSTCSSRGRSSTVIPAWRVWPRCGQQGRFPPSCWRSDPSRRPTWATSCGQAPSIWSSTRPASASLPPRSSAPSTSLTCRRPTAT